MCKTIAQMNRAQTIIWLGITPRLSYIPLLAHISKAIKKLNISWQRYTRRACPKYFPAKTVNCFSPGVTGFYSYSKTNYSIHLSWGAWASSATFTSSSGFFWSSIFVSFSSSLSSTSNKLSHLIKFGSYLLSIAYCLILAHFSSLFTRFDWNSSYLVNYSMCSKSKGSLKLIAKRRE